MLGIFGIAAVQRHQSPVQVSPARPLSALPSAAVQVRAVDQSTPSARVMQVQCLP